MSNEKYKTVIFYYYILQSIHNQQGLSVYRSQNFLKGTVMQIEKALINNPLRASEVSWKFHVPTIYNFAVIYPWNLLFSWKVAYLSAVPIVFSIYKQNFTGQ